MPECMYRWMKRIGLRMRYISAVVCRSKDEKERREKVGVYMMDNEIKICVSFCVYWDAWIDVRMFGRQWAECSKIENSWMLG